MERPPNTGGPTAEVMAVSALGATIAEYKRALASNDFKEAMTLDEHELTLLIGSDERAHGLRVREGGLEVGQLALLGGEVAVLVALEGHDAARVR